MLTQRLRFCGVSNSFSSPRLRLFTLPNHSRRSAALLRLNSRCGSRFSFTGSLAPRGRSCFASREIEPRCEECWRITVLYASELFGVERIPNIRAAFDVVDWFLEHERDAARLEEIRSSLRGIAAEMDVVFGVSEPLCEKLARECAVTALALPNGADLGRLRSVPAEKVKALRARLGIENKFVVGYIGNHGPFTGVDLVVNAFLAARDRLPDSALLIVGPAQHWRGLLDANRSNGIIATSGVSPAEVATYFNALDVGVLAQGITTGTDFAFQIKVVEYSACRKIVVSTPLETWKRLAWPNVLLAEANAIAWADALVRARAMRWQSYWDRFVEPYDWSILANRIADALLVAPASK